MIQLNGCSFGHRFLQTGSGLFSCVLSIIPYPECNNASLTPAHYNQTQNKLYLIKIIDNIFYYYNIIHG